MMRQKSRTVSIPNRARESGDWMKAATAAESASICEPIFRASAPFERMEPDRVSRTGVCQPWRSIRAR